MCSEVADARARAEGRRAPLRALGIDARGVLRMRSASHLPEIVAALALGTLVACASAGTVAPVASSPAGAVSSASSASSASSSAAASASASAPAAAQGQTPVYYAAGGELWRVGVDGADAKSMHVTFDETSGGATGIGAGAPLLSRDRRWLAFLRADDLWVARTDGSDAHRITAYNGKGAKTGADLLISGFSPDCATLLFHVAEQQREDEAPPLPKGTLPGFYSLRLDTFASTRLPQVEGFTAFRGDSKSVVDSKFVAASSYELREYPLGLGAAAGPPRTLRTSKEAYGFSQLVLEGDRLAFVSGGAVVVGPADGGPLVPATAKGAFAEQQFPQFAPDGAHLLFELHKGPSVAMMVVPAAPAAGAKPTPPVTVCTQCAATWHDASRLVVAAAGSLRLVGLDGKSVPLAAKGSLLQVGTH
jgi:hypothetical protein